MPVSIRQAIQAQVGQVRPRCATIIDVRQHPATGWRIVRYQVPDGNSTLQQVQQSGNVQGSLLGLAAVFEALPDWWKSISMPLLPMPADVVLTSTGGAILLPWVSAGVPRTSELFEEPARGAFLAPELFREGIPMDPARQQSPDLFALGAMLLGCFFQPSDSATAAEAVSRAAIGDACRWRSWRDTIPFWIDQIRLTDNIVAVGSQLASPRSAERLAIDRSQMSVWLRNCSERMEPLAAFREAAQDSTHRALELLENLRLENETYELLVEGAMLAWKEDIELKAMQLYERAIELEPSRPEAYRGQFEVIAYARDHPNQSLSIEYAQRYEFARYLDNCIRRDFEMLEKLGLADKESRELRMAQHELWRAHQYISTAQQNSAATDDLLQSAGQCLHNIERLVQRYTCDRNGKALAWKLRLRAVGCEARLHQTLLRRQESGEETYQRGLDEVKSCYNGIRDDVTRYQSQSGLRHEVQAANQHLTQLHQRLNQLN